MLIDRTHKKWLLGTLVALAISLAAYIPYRITTPNGPAGGSAVGLAYGAMGFALMVFAGLLGVRKKVPVWRIGRAQTWMRGHLWLGLLSFPLILFHAGFAFGGPLTTVLMALFIVVVASGLIGAALQHFLPRIMLADIPMETVFEQIASVRRQLLEEAEKLVKSACQPQRLEAAVVGVAHRSQAAMDASLIVQEKDAENLKEFFHRVAHPYLANAPEGKGPLGDGARAQVIFQQVRLLLSPGLHEALDSLENICEEKRQLDRQRRMHYLLHGWLLVHVPLSLALLLLAAVHAVKALLY